jgi:phosphoribosylformimino-5-aminoimidazole carboxamide ribotide isomerase
MKIIPVLDILNGKVVHAIRGKRNGYQPVKSVLCNSAEPLAVASSLCSLGFNEIYIADLDAIMEKISDFSLIGQIIEKTGLKIILDSGIDNIETIKKLFSNKVSKVILASESIPSLDFLRKATATYGENRIIVSLDLSDGKILSKTEEITKLLPLDFIMAVQAMGIKELIVLNLEKVGSNEGVDLKFLKRLIDLSNLKVYVGGGIRNLADLVKLEENGIYGVLLATALHKGQISSSECKKIMQNKN